MQPLNLTIRDAIEGDLAACLSLDHRYDSDHVWQVTRVQEASGYRLTVKPERLPRSVSLSHEVSEARVRLALETQCLLVAVEKEAQLVLAYAVLRYDEYHRIATVCDLVVERAVRRMGVGTRVFNALRHWAHAHHSSILTAEVQHKNYPAIQFVQRQGLTFSGINDRYFADHEIALFFSSHL